MAVRSISSQPIVEQIEVRISVKLCTLFFQNVSTYFLKFYRNVIVGAALFRRGGHRVKNKLSEAESCLSIASVEKGDFLSELDKSMMKRKGSIMKPSQQNLRELISYQPCNE